MAPLTAGEEEESHTGRQDGRLIFERSGESQRPLGAASILSSDFTAMTEGLGEASSLVCIKKELICAPNSFVSI